MAESRRFTFKLRSVSSNASSWMHNLIDVDPRSAEAFVNLNDKNDFILLYLNIWYRYEIIDFSFNPFKMIVFGAAVDESKWRKISLDVLRSRVSSDLEFHRSIDK